MSAAEALRAARAAGIHLGIDSDDLVLEASLPPPAAVLDALSRHKAEIVELLEPGRDGWSTEDWQVFFDERAGIAEFDGGLPRAEAEAQAFACCVAEWLNRNPERWSAAKAVSALAAMGISAPVVRPMKRAERSKHLPSDATRESRTAKNQFAFQRQMNGG